MDVFSVIYETTLFLSLHSSIFLKHTFVISVMKNVATGTQSFKNESDQSQ